MAMSIYFEGDYHHIILNFKSAPPLVASQSSNPLSMAQSTSFYNYFANRDPYTMSLPVLQREFDTLKREYESSLQVIFMIMLPYLNEHMFS